MSRTKSPVYALQSAKPEEVDAWLSERLERLAQFKVSCDALEKEVGGTPIVRQSYWDLSLDGFEPADRTVELPDGWRRERSYPYYAVPALRSKAGKALAASLAMATVPLPPPPGLPSTVRAGLVMGQFLPEQLNGRWYATLTFDPQADTIEGVDPERWFPAPLSRYWEDRETMDALAPKPEEP